jgi:hypothetical protein
MPKVCIIKTKKIIYGQHKDVYGQHQDVSGHHQTHGNWAIGQSGKKEADSTKRTHC